MRISAAFKWDELAFGEETILDCGYVGDDTYEMLGKKIGI